MAPNAAATDLRYQTLRNPKTGGQIRYGISRPADSDDVIVGKFGASVCRAKMPFRWMGEAALSCGIAGIDFRVAHEHMPRVAAAPVVAMVEDEGSVRDRSIRHNPSCNMRGTTKSLAPKRTVASTIELPPPGPASPIAGATIDMVPQICRHRQGRELVGHVVSVIRGSTAC
jgi:hypothetical protein